MMGIEGIIGVLLLLVVLMINGVEVLNNNDNDLDFVWSSTLTLPTRKNDDDGDDLIFFQKVALNSSMMTHIMLMICDVESPGARATPLSAASASSAGAKACGDEREIRSSKSMLKKSTVMSKSPISIDAPNVKFSDCS